MVLVMAHATACLETLLAVEDAGEGTVLVHGGDSTGVGLTLDLGC